MREQIDVIKPRRVAAALLLSLGVTGLGQVYCGRPGRGIAFFLAGLALFPVTRLAAPLAPQGALVTWMLAFLCLYLFVSLAALVDAARLARGASKAYMIKPYNRWSVYVLAIVLSVWGTGSFSGNIRDSVAEPFKIPSASMMPTILPGDYLLLDKSAYAHEPPRRGDLIIFSHPNNRAMAMLKRIIALPGDTVEVRQGTAYVNGLSLAREADSPSIAPRLAPEDADRLLEERNGDARYPILARGSGQADGDYPRIVVPNGCCFVLGDNRSLSSDSREYGPVPLADVRGRVDSIYIPAASWARFGAVR